MPADQNSVQKLPVIDTVKKSFQLFCKQPMPFLHAYWPVLAIMVLQIPLLSSLDQDLAEFQTDPGSKSGLVTLILFSALVWFIAGIIGSINLYRLALLGEQPRGLALQFGKREIRYAGWEIGFGLLLALLVIVVIVVSIFIRPALYVLLPLAAVFTMVVVYRLIFIWPALALDHDVNWRTSFAQTKGNVLRLMGGIFLVAAPMMAISFVLQAISGPGNMEILISLLLLPMQFVTAIIVILFTALAYYILAPETHLSQPDAPQNTDVFI